MADVDFRKIRLGHGGTRHGGFEDMTVQLFAREQDVARRDVAVYRVEGAGGDGGVEAYAQVPGVGKVGLQAKYFVDAFDDAQLTQIHESVRTALANHPDLQEYRVYVPRDLTDKKGATKATPSTQTRVRQREKKSAKTAPGRKPARSQREKWDDYVAKWKKLPNGADVNFVWQGRFEMQSLLQQAAYHDVRAYWFGTPFFDDAWMDREFEKMKVVLRERYQPELNVSGKVTRDLDTFVWSPTFERRVERALTTFVKAVEEFGSALEQMPDDLWTEGEA